MEVRTLRAIIKSAVIAGLVAAVLIAAFHFVVTEPVIDRAIDMERLLSQSEGNTGYEPVVTRDVQRAGLFLGFLIYGLIWALVVSVIYHLAQNWLPNRDVLRRGLLVALLTGWSVALFPFLKYPANPPGVGDPETIGYRQTLYLAFIALSALTTVVAFALHRYLRVSRLARYSRPLNWVIVSAVYIMGAAVSYLVMPVSPDVIRMPADLVWTFRVLSLAGLAIFWAVFAGIFAWLILERKRYAGVPSR